MTNTEILTKAIQKAIDGGWNMTQWLDEADASLFTYWLMRDSNSPGVYEVIFNHDFAKALWGEHEHGAYMGMDDYGEEDCSSCGHGGGSIPDYCWQYHLQQMVIAEDPIKYLGEHLDG